MTNLRTESLTRTRQLADDCLTSLISEMEKEKRCVVETSLQLKGFYLSKEQLVNDCFLESNYTLTDLKEALIQLDTFMTTYWSHQLDRTAMILKWCLIAPFSFAKKQLLTMGKPCDVMPNLWLGGASQTAKSSLLRYLSNMYIPITNDTSFQSINTPARFGDKVNKTTMFLLVNEAHSLFDKKYTEIREMIKDTFENLEARSIFKNYTNRVRKLAVCSLAFTCNRPISTTDAEQRRLVKYSFIHTDKKTILKNKDQYELFAANKWKLKPIGWFTYRFLAEKLPLLNEHYTVIAEEVLTHLYSLVGLPLPAFVSIRYQDEFEDIDMKTELLKAIGNYAVKQLLANKQTLDEKTPRSVALRLKMLTERNLTTAIYCFGNTVYILKDFLVYLSELNLDVESLKDLAELLEGNYTKVQKRGFINNYCVVLPIKAIEGDSDKLEKLIALIRHKPITLDQLVFQLDGLLTKDEVMEGYVYIKAEGMITEDKQDRVKWIE